MKNIKIFGKVMSQMHSCGVKKGFYLLYDDEKNKPWDLQVKEVEISESHVKNMCTKIKDADVLIDGYLEKCEGVAAMLPHEANIILEGIYYEIRNLKEVW